MKNFQNETKTLVVENLNLLPQPELWVSIELLFKNVLIYRRKINHCDGLFQCVGNYMPPDFIFPRKYYKKLDLLDGTGSWGKCHESCWIKSKLFYSEQNVLHTIPSTSLAVKDAKQNKERKRKTIKTLDSETIQQEKKRIQSRNRKRKKSSSDEDTECF